MIINTHAQAWLEIVNVQGDTFMARRHYVCLLYGIESKYGHIVGRQIPLPVSPEYMTPPTHISKDGSLRALVFELYYKSTECRKLA